MTDARKISGLADLAEAAYADFETIPIGGLGGEALKALLSQQRYQPAWPEARRDEFALHWRVVAHQSNTGNLFGPGFSGTVFERIDPAPGESRFVVAMRGTEGNVLTQLVPDLAQADIADLVANGLAW